MDIRDRIIELKRVPANHIEINERNFRIHPEQQRSVLRGVLREIGIADALLAYYSERNGGKLTLIDGELRKTDNPDVEWPTIITDLNDEEADKLLAVHDPMTALADTDGEKLTSLLREVQTSDEAIRAMLEDLARECESLINETKEQGQSFDAGNSNYREQYGVIVICADEAEQEKVYNHLRGLGYNCRVVVT